MIRNAVVGLILGLSLPSAVIADDPSEILLTVSGLGDPVTYDREALEALGAESFETSTIWTQGTQTFTGVSLVKLLGNFEVDKGQFSATAINDYAVAIPVSDAVEGGPIIAYEMNGAPMSVRDKGPLWLVYPYDANPDYRSEVIYSRSIWQLDRIDIAK
jgi:hypothetical protein